MFGLRPKYICKILNKYLPTVTEIPMSPKEVSMSRGWHIKENGHTYLFCAIFFFIINVIWAQDGIILEVMEY